MRESARRRIWEYFRRYVPEGCVLPRWLIVVRAVLYPLQTFYWWMSRREGYDMMTDTWMIAGVRYSAVMLQVLASSDGEIYRVVCRDGVVMLTRMMEPSRVSI